MLLLSVLIIIVCALLILIVLIQNPKGGGLSSSFGGGGGSTQIFGGVKKTTDFLDRGTWVLAIALVALVLFANVTSAPTAEGQQRESSISEELSDAPVALPPTTNTLPPSNNDLTPEPVPEDPAE